MNQHALRVLEFARVREMLAAYAATSLGRESLASLQPLDNLAEIRSRLDEARELGDFLQVARLPMSGFRDVAARLRDLVDGGRPGEPDLLYDVLQLVRGGLALREALTRDPREFPALHRLGSALRDLPDLRDLLERQLDAREGLRDDATEKLAQLRAELRRARESLRRRVQRLRTEPRLQRALQNEGLKFQHDRYLLAVKVEYRQHVPGVIRDRSVSGATLYVEPESLVAEGDRLLELVDSERDEVQRILWELTRAVLAREEELRDLQLGVARVDEAHAKARLATSFALTYPRIEPPREGEPLRLELRETRHPYLMWLSRDSRKALTEQHFDDVASEVVPLDIRLGDPHRLVVVTGPNTGGKTVALKTVGLAVLMALSGVPVAAASGATVPHVDQVFADIGDEQSIEQSLSTFSSHLKHLVEVLETADERSLVLIDELGAGTDPLEGAALATAILEHFKQRGWHAIITTHLSSLKEYAFAHPEVENAAMEFDVESLRPTFRLVTGLPGRSHALEIARRAGIPPDIVAAAESKVREVQAPTRELIEKMVHSHRRMEKERRRMERLRQRAQGERRAAEEEREVAQSEREMLRQEADAYVDQTVREAREKLRAIVHKLTNAPRSLQPTLDELRWAIELLLTGTPLGQKREEFARSLKKDDEVYVPKFRELCKVRKINKGERVVTVLLNGIPTAVSFDDVSWIDPDAPA